jgi:hypothetical protein
VKDLSVQYLGSLVQVLSPMHTISFVPKRADYRLARKSSSRKKKVNWVDDLPPNAVPTLIPKIPWLQG